MFHAFISRNGENWIKFLFNPLITLGSVITKVPIFHLFMPQEPAVLQIYNYLLLMSLNPCISFKLLTSVLNKTQLTFPPTTHEEVQSFIFQEN